MSRCGNCGGEAFEAMDRVRAGRFGRTALADGTGIVRPLRARLCRSCGHVDLFVDPPAPEGIPVVATNDVAAGEAIAPPATEPPAPVVPAAAASVSKEWSEASEPPSPERRRASRRRPPPKARSSVPPLIHD